MRLALASALAGLLSLALGSSPSPPPSTITMIASTVTNTVIVTASPTIASDAPQFASGAAVFSAAVLNSTNAWRGQFGAAAVAWNETLAAFATSYLASMGFGSGDGGGGDAPVNGSECEFAHSGGPYGENIALGCLDVTGCVDLCEYILICLSNRTAHHTSESRRHIHLPREHAEGRLTLARGEREEEVKVYNYNDPDYTESSGHFTQLVWKNTTTVGCGSKLCGLKQWYRSLLCQTKNHVDFASADSGRFLVCEYWPRGNVIGEFGSEVGQRVNDSSRINSTSPRRLWCVISLVFLTMLWLTI